MKRSVPDFANYKKIGILTQSTLRRRGKRMTKFDSCANLRALR